MHEEVNKSEEKTLDATEELLAEKAASLDAEIVEELLAEDQLSETEELQEQVSKANDQVLRIQAEMQNVRRRAERDVENAHKYALDKFTADLLPVVDNLERALSTIDAADEAQKAVNTGLELTLKTFVDVLARLKLKRWTLQVSHLMLIYIRR